MYFDATEFAARLSTLRKAQGMTQEEMAEALNISLEHLSKMERGKRKPSIDLIIAMACYFHVSTDYLLCQTELCKHTNKSVYDLHLNDDAVQILTNEKYNPRLLSELIFHENFHKFMIDLEIYIDGFNDKGIQIANALAPLESKTTVSTDATFSLKASMTS